MHPPPAGLYRLGAEGAAPGLQLALAHASAVFLGMWIREGGVPSLAISSFIGVLTMIWSLIPFIGSGANTMFTQFIREESRGDDS